MLNSMFVIDLTVYAVLLLGALWSFGSHRLTLAGAITGAVTGFIIYKGAGLVGFIMLTCFFVLASVATKWQSDKKTMINATEDDKGPRTCWQVFANSGVASLLAMLACYKPELLSATQFMIAGSFAAATADTLSSELGTVYGSRFYNIITLKKDARGLNGVISLEGTFIGIIGACLIAVIFAVNFGWDFRFMWIVLGGFTGNLVDSLLGATLERKGLIGNNMVNLLNTLTGAIICWLWV